MANKNAGSKRMHPGEFNLNIQHAEEPVFLVKIPELLAHAWEIQGANGQNDLGFLEFSKNASDQETIRFAYKKDGLPSENAMTTPQNYTLSLTNPQGHRVISLTDQEALLDGIVSRSGVVIPDPKDPCYGAYTQKLKARRLENKKARPTTSLLTAAEIPNTILDDRNTQATIAPTEAAIQERMASPVVKAGATLFSLFEDQPYWSRRQLIAALSPGIPEAKLIEDIAQYCDYLRSGSQRGKYILKPVYRSIKSAPLDEEYA